MDRELQRDYGVPLEWYDVLIKLWLAPGKRLRMSDLAEQALLSRSWLTRRVMQLEEGGLVLRYPAGPEDGRGVVAAMTDEGQRVFAELERSHARSIADHFSQFVTDEEAVIVARCLGRIAEAGRAALTEPIDSTASAPFP